MSSQFYIIGSGISGLVLAYELAKKGNSVRIFESLNVCGGLTRSESISGVNYDCGPHLYHTNNEDIKNYWFNIMGDAIVDPDLYGANYIDNKIYEYPLSIESLHDQFDKNEVSTIMKELKNLDKKKLNQSKNYSEYVSNLAGNYLSKKFFKRYPEKLWGIPTTKLSAKFAPRRVEIRKERRPFHSGKGKWAGVLKGGCGVLAKSLEKKLNTLGIYIEYGSTLNKIKLSNKNNGKYKSISELNFLDKKRIKISDHDQVISTMPITELAKILKIKNKLWNRSLKIFCIHLNGKVRLPDNYDWLYFDDKNLIFHRVTLQNSFSEEGLPKDTTVFSCEVAYNKNEKIDKLSPAKIKEKCIKDLLKVNLIKKKDIIGTHLIDAKAVYPGIYVGYENELSKLKGKLSFIDNLYSHGALAEYEYADTQVLTAKSIDLADSLTKNVKITDTNLKKQIKFIPSTKLQINNTSIGYDEKCFIISEIGLNHNGNVELCKKLIDQSKRAGASAVKLQTYKKGRISANTRTARYYEDLIDTQESLSSFVDNISFSFNQTKEIFRYASEKKITIFSTPFDLESLKILEKLNCPAYKISSMDLVNYPLIEAVGRLQKPIIISTGMSDLTEISQAVEILKSINNTNFALLHCVSSYPCSPSNANLPMISKLKDTFNCIVGYSDHTTGIDVSLAAAANGAKIIEKHFTLDRKMDGPDHNFSLIEDELSSLVSSVRRIEEAKYDHGFGVMSVEVDTAQNLRRSIFYRKNVSKGTKLKLNDLEIKSPGIGLHPKEIGQIVGKTIIKSVKKDFPVSWEDIKN